MTLDERLSRDATIARLEAIGDARTPEQNDQLIRLHAARDHQFRRLAAQIAVAQRRIHDLETWAQRHSLPLPA